MVRIANEMYSRIVRERETLMKQVMQHSVFAVCETPYCVWGWDLAERNLRFLDGVDEEYFTYVAETHTGHLDDKNAQLASVALQQAYHLSLETLFSLMGAALQAPDCVVGWILKAQTSQVRKLTSALQRGVMDFPMKWRLDSAAFGFGDVAKLVMQFASWAQDGDDPTVARFAGLWNRLAHDFLDENMTAEYNSIKHGFRARPGGVTVRFGQEHEYGVAPPKEEMRVLGSSVFGTSFYAAQPVEGSPERRGDPHFMLRHHSLNWNPHDTAGRMFLTALSIKNLRSFLAAANGRPPGEVTFTRPPEPSAFEEPWRHSPRLTHFGLDLNVSEGDISRVSRGELEKILNSKTENDDRSDE